MNIRTKLAELEYLRDAALREMGDNATHLSEHLKTHYSPANMLRRHLRPALGLAATVAVLIARAKTPQRGGLHMIWSQLFNRTMKRSQKKHNPDASAVDHPPSGGNGQPAGETPEQNHHGIRNLVQPIIRNILLDVAQAITWK